MHSDAHPRSIPRPLFEDGERVGEYVDAGYAVLTPNRRLSRAVREAEERRRRDRGETAWDSPVIAPLKQFFCDRWHQAVTMGVIPPRRLLDTAAHRLLWERVIEADHDAGFTLLNPRRAADLCQRADEQLTLWRIDPSAEPWRLWFQSAEDSRAFLRWRDRLDSALVDSYAITAERALVELLAALDGPAPASSLTLPPLLLLHCDEPAPLHAALQERAPQAVTLGPPEQRVQPDRIRAFIDEDAEMAAAARWCREQADADPQGRYAVVMQDMGADRARFETLLRREFDCLAANYDRLPVNFATGYSLGAMPIIRDALRILSLAGDEAILDDALALLQSRFVAPLTASIEHAERAVRRLRELAAEHLPTRLLRAGLDELLPAEQRPGPWDAVHILTSRGLRLGRSRYPSAWLEVYRCLLEAWQWGRGVSLDSLEYQQRQHWEAALDGFAGLDDVLGSLDFATSLSELRRLIEGQPFQPQTTDRAVQVLGPLETTGLSFDGLWITGLDADAWPAPARPNPYLPLGMQRELRMPGCDAKQEQEAAERRWRHWASSTTSLEVSYVVRKDDVERLPSALLAGVDVLRDDAGAPFDPRWLSLVGAAMDPVPLQAVPLEPSDAASLAGGSGLLEDQIACPFRAFAGRRLHVDAPPTPQAGLLASERGSLMHAALFQLFERYPDRATLRSATTVERRHCVDGAIDVALRTLPAARRQLLGAGVLSLEKDRLTSLLLTWLDLEAARELGFTVQERETDREVRLGELTLKLRLDRVDRLEDGSLLLIDYKSGRIESTAAWLSAPPTRPQMPLYALAEPAAQGVALAYLRPGELAWRGISETGGPPGVVSVAGHKDLGDLAEGGGFPALQRRWQDDLLPVVEAFLDGDCSVDPQPDACRYCGRHSLCRIGEESA